MAYTAITPRRIREEAGSLAKKLATEFGLIASRINLSGDMTLSDAGVATIADDAVTAAKADIFKSAEITSTAAAKAEAHGLGASPSVFFAILQATAASASPAMSATADATNVYVTAASTDVKYIVFAWL